MDTCKFCGSQYGSGFRCEHYRNGTPTVRHPFVSNPNLIEVVFKNYVNNSQEPI